MPVPERSVVDWFAEQPPAAIFTSAVTETEILYGLRLLPDGRRRRDLEAAILPIFAQDLAGRVLPFDPDAAHVYGPIAPTGAELAALSANSMRRSPLSPGAPLPCPAREALHCRSRCGATR